MKLKMFTNKKTKLVAATLAVVATVAIGAPLASAATTSHKPSAHELHVQHLRNMNRTTKHASTRKPKPRSHSTTSAEARARQAERNHVYLDGAQRAKVDDHNMVPWSESQIETVRNAQQHEMKYRCAMESRKYCNAF